MSANLNQDEAARREVLTTSPVVAVVGMSDDHYYTSYDVGTYLERVGFTVYPVNPTIEDVDGERAYPSLEHLPERPDIVVVFRKSAYLSDVVDDAIKVGAKTVWAQLGVHDDSAVQKALEAGLNVATDMCIRTEHKRLFRDMVEG